MKWFAALILFAGLAGSLQARPQTASRGTAAFEQLKTLVGEWEGAGHPGKVTYTLASGGTVLMERLQSPNEPEMITMYSADGDSIIATHYCSAGNQPQMKSAVLQGAPLKYSFALVRVTGLKSDGDGYMVGLVLKMADKDHLTQEWSYSSKGKVSTDAFQFKRKTETPASIVAPHS
jgi:hypothetical protein